MTLILIVTINKNAMDSKTKMNKKDQMLWISIKNLLSLKVKTDLI
jgi:hypothetical protein